MGKDSKKKKKDKKHKSKHEKKHKKRKHSSSESESSDEWVEKDTSNSIPRSADHQVEKFDLMENLFAGKTRSELNEAKKIAEDKKESTILEKPGQSTRELNPFWKDGGTGLPSEDVEAKSKTRVGDGGAGFLRKALERAHEEARSEGCSVEEVISRRWGSMEEFNKKLKEAESISGPRHHGYSSSRYHHSQDRGYSYRERKMNFRKPDSESSENHDRSYTSRENKFNFRKPDSESRDSDSQYKTYQSSSSGKRNWRKPEFSSNIENSSSKSSENSSKIDETVKDIPTEKPSQSKDTEDGKVSVAEIVKLNTELLKAELMGKKELAAELKKKLLASVPINYTDNKTDVKIKTIIVDSSSTGKSGRRAKVQTHEQNKRVRYFADDDKHSLEEMFQKEKNSTGDDQDALFFKLSSQRGRRRSTDDEEVFDKARFVDNSRSERKKAERILAKEKSVEHCRWCISNRTFAEHIVYKTDKVFVAVPSFQPLSEQHCLIVPYNHVPAATMLDEDVWDEIMDIRKKLVGLYAKDEDDVIFFESALNIQRDHHMVLQCVPIPKEVGDTAPIYFKKAISECESEWTNNKKVVELAGRNVRKAVPKGLPYFAVDFGLQGGYAHVIEDKQLFSHYFAQEIIGGMLDLDHTIWRKPRRDTTENIKRRADSLKTLLS